MGDPGIWLADALSVECSAAPRLDLEWLYVGHADAPRYLSALRMELAADRRLPPEGDVDVLCSVVGSWSFLSLLLSVRPKRLLLFDANPAPVAFFAAVLALLRASASRHAFLSYFLARRVTPSDVAALEAEAVDVMRDAAIGASSMAGASLQLLGRPVETALVRGALEVLRAAHGDAPGDWHAHREVGVPSLPCTYLEYVAAFLARAWRREAPSGESAPPWRICDVLRIVGHPMNAPVNVGRERRPGDPPNACSLFFSHGWLSSDAAFRLVRERLLAADRQYVVANLLEEGTRGAGGQWVQGHETSVMYLSNIQPGASVAWADEQALGAKLEQLLVRVRAGGGYLKILNRDRWFTFGSRPHLTALVAVERALGADARRLLAATGPLGGDDSSLRGAPGLPLVEVVAQDLRIQPGWGFHELNRTQVMHHADFRAKVRAAFPRDGSPYTLPLQERACVLHILVGEGALMEDFRETLQLATASCRRVAVLEHNRLSRDFSGEEDAGASAAGGYLDPERLREVVRQICGDRQRMLSDCGLVRTECAYGREDHCRNFVGLVEVFGTAVHATPAPP